MRNNTAPITNDELRRIRLEAGLSVPDAALAIGVNRTTWWRWEEQGVDVPTKLIRAVRELGSKAPARAAKDDTMVQVPTYAWHVGEWLDFQPENASGHLGLERAYVKQRLQADPDTLAAFAIDGDCMEPTVRSGEIAIVSMVKPGAMVTDGIHLLRLDGALLCKRIARMPGHRIVVTSDNPANEDQFELELLAESKDAAIIGRVLLVLRQL